jgi:cellulose synthase/poly-beta-1,6-N-acetylglucosamine synthase-like glycosyltransferase
MTIKLMDIGEVMLQGCARDGSADKPLATVLWTLTGAVPRTVTVAICIPSSGRYCPPEWGIALALLQCPPNTNQIYLTIKGAKRDRARNELVEQALSYNTRYVLFLDDDNPPPPDTLYKLLQVMDSSDDDVAVCAGIYGTKTNPSAPLVFQGESVGSFWKWKKGDVFECERIATGCMMIRASAFARIPKPWFVDIESTEQAREHNLLSPVSNPPYYQMTDDIYFCRKVREAGMRILAHGGVLPGHWDEHGNVYFLPDDSYPMVPR